MLIAAPLLAMFGAGASGAGRGWSRRDVAWCVSVAAVSGGIAAVFALAFAGSEPGLRVLPMMLAIVGAAAAVDARFGVIPNVLPSAAGVLAVCGAVLSGGSWAAVWVTVGVAVTLLTCYALGALGAGDVKLLVPVALAVTSSYTNPAQAVGVASLLLMFVGLWSLVWALGARGLRLGGTFPAGPAIFLGLASVLLVIAPLDNLV